MQEVKMMTEKPVLTFVPWAYYQAVYLDDKLIYYAEVSTCYGLLAALGFVTRGHLEVPTHDLQPEFALNDNGRWWPPESLAVLEQQFAAWETRLKAERIADLRRELAELEKGVT